MKNILIVGLGRFGYHMAERLSQMRIEVMGVDMDERAVNDALPFMTDGKIGDSTDEAFLRSLGVSYYDLCIVTIGDDFRSSLETTALLKDMDAQRVVSVASSERHANFLLRNGADEVIFPEKQLGEWAAIRFGSNHVTDYFALDKENAFCEVDVPDNWVGRTVGGLDIRRNHRVSIIGVRRNGQIDMGVTADTVLYECDNLMVVGKYKDIVKCFRL